MAGVRLVVDLRGWPSSFHHHRLQHRGPGTAAVRTLLLVAVTLVACAPSASGGEGPQTVTARTVNHRGRYMEQLIDEDEPTELKLVHVLFRHGDRTPDREEMELYPDDPNIDNTFEPYGLKALTNAGKAREYHIGVVLRKLYDGFLDRLYVPREIYVRTTDYDRTKMSALACLAGLYPPVESQRWHEGLNWQPIPYHTLPYEEDDMMYYYTCPRFLEARIDELETPRFQKKLEPYRDLFAMVSQQVGRNLTTPEEIFYIDNLFQAELNYNIQPPEWASQAMDRIREMTVIEYELQFATDELKRVGGGTLLQKMITDSYAKIKNTLEPSDMKMFLYSGHENNVAALLACTHVFEAHQPQYASTYILELRQKTVTKTYGFRILYLKDIYGEAETLQIPGCGRFCPFDRFVQLTNSTVTSTLKADCVTKRPIQA